MESKRGRKPKIDEFLQALYEGLEQEKQKEKEAEIIKNQDYLVLKTEEEDEGIILFSEEDLYKKATQTIIEEEDSSFVPDLFSEISIHDQRKMHNFKKKQQKIKEEQQLKEYQEKVHEDCKRAIQYIQDVEKKESKTVETKDILTKKDGRGRCKKFPLESLSLENQQRIRDILKSPDNEDGRITLRFRLIISSTDPSILQLAKKPTSQNGKTTAKKPLQQPKSRLPQRTKKSFTPVRSVSSILSPPIIETTSEVKKNLTIKPFPSQKTKPSLPSSSSKSTQPLYPWQKRPKKPASSSDFSYPTDNQSNKRLRN